MDTGHDHRSLPHRFLDNKWRTPGGPRSTSPVHGKRTVAFYAGGIVILYESHPQFRRSARDLPWKNLVPVRDRERQPVIRILPVDGCPENEEVPAILHKMPDAIR